MGIESFSPWQPEADRENNPLPEKEGLATDVKPEVIKPSETTANPDEVWEIPAVLGPESTEKLINPSEDWDE